MIRCEHCGSTLPDGAIFCGECGRAVTAPANRRPAATTPVEQAPPPPLRQPDAHGRRPDPAAEAWLPESTLDPATRAWLTGADRRDGASQPPAPAQNPDVLAPRAAPSHVYGAGSGLEGWPAPGRRDEQRADVDRAAAAPAEPPLDPDAFPASAVRDEDDPEVTRVADRPATETGSVTGDAAAGAAEAPRWSPPPAETQAPAAPSRPSWWIGRANGSTTTDEAAGAASASPFAPQPGDTAVVEPLVDRRPPRPTPLVTPGSGAATCHVCGHRLEPDDIFCAECGAVRPAVTAAFTGPVVPLPVAKPDWAAEHESDGPTLGDGPTAGAAGTDSAPVGAHPGDGESARTDDGESARTGDGDSARTDDGVSTPAGDEPATDELTTDEPVNDGPTTDQPTTGGPATDEPATHEPATDGPATDEPITEGDVRAGAADGTPAADDHPDGSTPRTPVRPRGVHAASTTDADQPAPGHRPAPGDHPAPGSLAIPPMPGSATVPSSAPHAAPLPPRSGAAVPLVAPLPPLPGAAVPGPSAGGATMPVLPATDADELPTSADDPDEDVDETRIVAKQPTEAPFVLHFSTGERFGVHGTGLLGRLPRPQPGERFDDLVTVHDPGKSVSKTHLELGRDGDDLWVSDRFSGNGTVVRHIDGSIRRCEPGRRYRVERGARVDIGEQFFLVQ